MNDKVRKARIDWAQKRVDEIASEISGLEDEISELEDEKDSLNTMIDALEDGEEVPVGDDEPAEFNIDPVPDYERGRIETLLAYGPLSGPEIADLEQMLEDDDFDRRRYQEIYNAHLATIHAHDDE